MSTLTNYQVRVLEGTPVQALTFLRTSATKVEIRARLFEAGYSEEEQRLGWRLLLDASGHRPESLPESDDAAARAALAEVDDWDEPGFRRVAAALGRLHPEQHAFVFDGLKAAQGQGALVSVTTLLDRLDALESAPDRHATREADHAALATLEQRGIGRQVREHLRERIAVALTAKAPVPTPEQPMTPEREQALRELRAWYVDWAETARAIITRRDHLIMLGLSRRKRSAHDEDEATDSGETDLADDGVDSPGGDAGSVDAAPTADGDASIAPAESSNPAASAAE
jgi:hypothetical protein